jgi:hypothetical protein
MFDYSYFSFKKLKNSNSELHIFFFCSPKKIQGYVIQKMTPMVSLFYKIIK